MTILSWKWVDVYDVIFGMSCNVELILYLCQISPWLGHLIVISSLCYIKENLKNFQSTSTWLHSKHNILGLLENNNPANFEVADSVSSVALRRLLRHSLYRFSCFV